MRRFDGGHGQTVGIGAGQMSRVDAARFGAMKAVLPLAGTVAASDAFFPFPDGLETVAEAGATAVIQPGGSVRDAEVIEAANRLGVAMVFTGSTAFPPRLSVAEAEASGLRGWRKDGYNCCQYRAAERPPGRTASNGWQRFRLNSVVSSIYNPSAQEPITNDLALRSTVLSSCRRFLPLAVLCATSHMLVAQTLKHRSGTRRLTTAPAASRRSAGSLRPPTTTTGWRISMKRWR